jgi:hypothetical protein
MIAEQHGRHRACDVLAEIDDANTFEHAGHVRPPRDQDYTIEERKAQPASYVATVTRWARSFWDFPASASRAHRESNVEACYGLCRDGTWHSSSSRVLHDWTECRLLLAQSFKRSTLFAATST